MVSGMKPSVIRIYDGKRHQSHGSEDSGRRDRFRRLHDHRIDGFKEIVDVEEKVALGICFKNGAKDPWQRTRVSWWKRRFDFYYPPFTLESSTCLYGVLDSCALHKDIENCTTA
jgi:hypothetical protein